MRLLLAAAAAALALAACRHPGFTPGLSLHCQAHRCRLLPAEVGDRPTPDDLARHRGPN